MTSTAPLPTLRDELAALHAPAFAWAVRCCRENHGDAEDVLQQAYLTVLEGRARFEGRSSFKTWLFGVIRQTARAQARRRWLRLALLESWWLGRPAESTDDRDAHEEIDQLRRALPRLSRRQQEVLHLVFYQDLTIQEAADVLGMPVGTARTHYERGKQRLRQLLETQE
ncbi:MAG: sigma-70 family RNA polymerase sigma factor [Gemmatimonadaceae bacterium]